MRREEWNVGAPAPGGSNRLIAYGHWGTPVLFFSAEAGGAHDLESRGIIDALAEPIDAGRLKIYAVDSYDRQSWSDQGLPTEERARRHEGYHHWIVEEVAPAIHRDCGGPLGIATAGVSMGAFHAVNFALRRADLFPHALGMSGNYDPTTWHPWGDLGDASYFNNPFAYIANMHGDHLLWLRRAVFVQLCVGSGPFETHPTQALPSSKALARALWDKSIPCGLDVWGEDTPHDWPSWRRMVAKHLAPLG
jgi:esterase/lipase superfamily enzyme